MSGNDEAGPRQKKTDEEPTSERQPALSEWGLPDWRDESAYGDTSKWTLDRWCWEFLRRRNDLRDFFDKWAHRTFKLRDIPANEGLSPDMPGFSAYADKGVRPNGMELFGLNGIPNPRIGEQPRWAIIPSDRFIRPLNYIDPTKERASNNGVRSCLGPVKWNLYEVRLDENQYAIRFDLDKPLPEQIETARQTLRAQQRQLYGHLIQKRHQQTKWLGYLRSLDAREDGASYAEIATCFPDTAGTVQTARDKLKQADELRNNF